VVVVCYFEKNVCVSQPSQQRETRFQKVAE
jgi:hypothetical protein